MIKPAEISGLRTAGDLERLIEERFNNDFEKFAGQLSQSLNQMLGSDLKQASRLIEGLKKSHSLYPESFRARLLAMEARYHHRTGHPKHALKLYRKAIEISRHHRDWLRVAQMRQGLMDVLMYLGEYSQAVQTGRLALTWFRRKDKMPAAARVMTNLGNIYHRLDKNRVALDYYDKAVAIFAKTGGVPLAIVQYNQANIYSNIGQIEQAAKLYQKAAETYRQSGMDLYSARAQYSLGYLNFLCDKHTNALTTFESVLEKFQRLGDDKAVAVTRLDLTEVNLHLNQYGTAIALGREAATELQKLGMRYELGKVHFFIAQALSRCGDYIPAGNSLRKAERIILKEDNLLWLGMVQLERSLLTRNAGRLEKSLEKAQEARGLFSRSGDERRCVDADIVIIETMIEADRHVEAGRYARKLIRRDLLLSQQYRLFHLLGTCYRERGDNDKALECFETATQKIEQMLDGLFPDEMRFFFAIDKLSTYLDAAECLLEKGHVSQSFERYLRGLSVVNYHYSPQRLRTELIPKAMLKKREQLRISLRRMEHLPRSEHRAISGLAEARRSEQQLWQLERRIRSSVYRRYDYGIAQVPDWSMDRLLRSDETSLGFAIFEQKTGVFVAHQGKVRYQSLGISTEELRILLRELHFVMERPVLEQSTSPKDHSVILHYLKRMYSLLLQPLESMITTNKLIIIADGLFSQVPWSALCDANGTYLKDKLRIRLLSDPTDLSNRRRPLRLSHSSKGSIFAVSSEYLPSVNDEGEGISKLFDKSRLYIGKEASAIHLKKRLRKKSAFLHIATHAARSSENPLFSRLLMSEGPFFPFDLFETGVYAHLVSLSGCQTAAPGLYYGNSFSLAKAFHQAGARFVLASLWSVSDRLSMEMMIEFYRQLGNGTEVVDAYYKAVDHIAGITDNPAFWSAFALIGI